jgi:MFS family permease
MQFTFGVFLKPIAQEFGVERGVASFALMIGLVATALSLPIAGRLADRFGPRTFTRTAVLLFGTSVAAVGLLAHNIWTFMLLFALAGVLASGQTPLPYIRVVTACFDRRRGLALALTLTGVGIGSIVVPIIAQHLVTAFGWRGGYVGLAALLLLVAVPAVSLFIPRALSFPLQQSGNAASVGLTVSEAVRSRTFWLMLTGLFLAGMAANGTIAHVVPLLTDRGVPAGPAVAALASVGAASIAGRLVGGFLLDRFWAPLVSLIFFTGMAAGIGLLAFAPSIGSASVAAVLIGLGLGVEADLIGFLLSRYIGLKSFGALFGFVFGAFMLANSFGPILMGALFDVTGSYAFCLSIFIGATFVAVGAFLMLGRYAYPAVRTEVAH